MSLVKKLFVPLYAQVLWGIALGALLGWASPDIGESMKPLGDGFIKLIKMVIPPVIFCTVVHGIAHMGDMKRAGKLGFKALIYFEVVTTIALIIGLAIGNFTTAGSGMNIDPSSIDASSISHITTSSHAPKDSSFASFILSLIPKTLFSGLIEGNLLQTLVAAILFAWALLGMGKAGAPVLNAIESLSHVFFRIVGIIMRLAPLGAFGAIAFTISKFGAGTLGALFGFVLLFYTSCIAFAIIVLGGILKIFTGLNIFHLIRYIRSELLIVVGTSSSETVLPRVLDKLERLGCEKQVVGMVLPTGYSFNLDGSSMYFTMAVLFLAHACNIDLSLSEQLSILVILLFTSKGAAAVVGSAFVVLVGTLATIDIIPVAAATLLLGIDRFMSEARALTNLVGNSVATLVVGHWEKSVDLERARKVLSGELHPHGDTDASEISLTAKPGLEEPETAKS